MKCPNCVLGDLQFFMRGELRFRTDEHGRPCGTADISTTAEQFWMTCDTCSASFEVQGWRKDGAGEVMLAERDLQNEDSEFEIEPEFPPPGTQRMD